MEVGTTMPEGPVFVEYDPETDILHIGATLPLGGLGETVAEHLVAFFYKNEDAEDEYGAPLGFMLTSASKVLGPHLADMAAKGGGGPKYFTSDDPGVYTPT